MTDLLLKDLIEIPESVHRSDFVVSLEDGISKERETTDRYVVTPQILECFQKALGLVAAALEQGESKGAYLHGSFGSGKSHFMAVLHLLLQGSAHARSRPEFGPLLEAYGERLEGRKILLVPYHMVGAESMESKVLGGYVDLIRRIRPDAPLPPVFLDHGLLEEAKRLRATMGDEIFFSNLGGGGEDDGFGDLVGGWDADRFDAAVSAAPNDAERAALVSDYIDAYASHLREVAGATGMGFVPFDKGLDAISQHAKSLGYDGVLLFLDELILWFASRMSDHAFVSREGPKVAKLVEAAASARPAPIISFIARQRDLRDFVGEGIPGAEAVNFDHVLRYWEGRFDVIELSDTNLREIVKQRVLRPKTPGAQEELDRAFARLYARGGSAMDAHLGDGDKEAFRRVYPFSPALVDTLVAVSNFLQRERTALRLLVQLLVNRKAELTVGDLIPMGDLYDVIRRGEDPFSDDLARHFVRTRNLYEQKFRPLLLAQHGLTDEAAGSVPDTHPFRTDDRLVKTLLLAALVGDAGPLRNLTVRRLADLNHGTIRTPIPGQERTAVLQRLQQWAPDIPELRLGEDPQDPTVSLRVSGVDVQGILDQAASADNAGARRAKIKELVTRSLDLDVNTGLLPARYSWIWRGSRRTVEVQFANIRDDRDLPTSAFRAVDVPKVLVDYPFDEDPQHGPSDDLARIDEVRREGEPTSTVAWLPAFFTDAALERLGKLVLLDHVLSGDRFDGYARNLSPQDRVEARHALENMQQAHREQLQQLIRQAYGLEVADERWIRSDLPLADQFPSLDPTLTLAPPTAATMKDSFEQLLGQVMRHRYPAHPEFEDEIRLADLRTALQHIERAVGARDHRVDIPSSDRRSVRRLLQPLNLAVTGEGHIVLKRDWVDHFRRHEAQIGGAPVTVERLRAWMDEPKPRGLDERVGNLLILAYALMDDRVFVRAGQTVQPALERLDAHTELRTQALPSEGDWEQARPLAQAIFGVDASPIRNAASVSTLITSLREVAEARRDGASSLASELGQLPAMFRAAADADRRRTADAGDKLVRDLLAARDVDAVSVLANAEVPTSSQALGRSLKTADEVVLALTNTNWTLLESAVGLAGAWAGRASAVGERIRAAAACDELVQRLGEVLTAEGRAATLLLAEAAGGGSAGGPKLPPDTSKEEPKPSTDDDPLEEVRLAQTPQAARDALTELEAGKREIDSIELRVRYRR